MDIGKQMDRNSAFQTHMTAVQASENFCVYDNSW